MKEIDDKQAAGSVELLNEVADLLMERNWRGDLAEGLRDLAAALASRAQPAGSVDTPEFRVLLTDLIAATEFSDERYAEPLAALISHIDSRAQPVAAGELPPLPEPVHARCRRVQQNGIVDCTYWDYYDVEFARDAQGARNFAPRSDMVSWQFLHTADQMRAYGQQCAGSSLPAGGVTDRDGARYRYLRHADLDAMKAAYWPGSDVPEGEQFDAVVDAAMKSIPLPAATLAASAALPAPDGWKLVPLEPTDAMMTAAETCDDTWPLTSWKKAWAAMLAASPTTNKKG